MIKWTKAVFYDTLSGMSDQIRTPNSFDSPAWDVARAFEGIAEQQLFGAQLMGAVWDLEHYVLIPDIDGKDEPRTLEEFDSGLGFLDSHLGSTARSVSYQMEAAAQSVVDTAETYVLDTTLLPKAFPARVRSNERLGELSFRGIGSLSRMVERRQRITRAGYRRITSPLNQRRDIARAYIDSLGGEDIRDESHDAAVAEGQIRDARLDSQIGGLATRYAHKMTTVVTSGAQYHQYLAELSSNARVALGNQRDYLPLEPRGNTDQNIVAKTRHLFLEHVFASLAR